MPPTPERLAADGVRRRARLAPQLAPTDRLPTAHRARRWLLAAAILVEAVLTIAQPVAAADPQRSAPVELPPVAPFDYQLGGGYPPPAGVRVVARDRTDRPVPGAYNICYVNAFQTQPGRTHWWRRHHPGLLLRARGKEVRDAAWGETLLDTSTARKRRAIARIVGRWIDGCATAGFRAVEPDNLDSYARSRGLLRPAHNLRLAGLLARRAHGRGLAVAQKNAAELSIRAHRRGLDFAVAEECAVWRECTAYTDVYGDHLLEIEYTDNGLRTFDAACRAAGRRTVLLRDRPLAPAGSRGYYYRSC